MEKDQELRFVCKWCDKKYPCGKSLGGHMRSHVIAAANSAESDEKLSTLMAETNLMKCEAPSVAAVAAAGGGINGEFGGPSGGYGLRENPKKTWRAVGSTFPIQQQERICKQCGKGFQSLKALCGHMACHSEKERVLKDDHSWTSEDPKLVMDGHSDTEEAEDLRPQTRSKSKRYKRIVVKSSHLNLVNNNSNNYGSSSVSEIYEPEQEEVAMCLMMLSRDSGNWGGVNSVVESSDNNSVILETKSSSIDMKLGRKGGLSLSCEALEMKKLGAARKFKLSALDAESVQLENSHSGYFRNGVKKVDSDISVDELFRYGEYRKPLKGHEAGVEISNAELGMGFNRGKYYETGVSKSFGKEKGFSEFGSCSKSGKYDLKRTRDGPDSPELRKESLRRLIYDDSSDGELSKNVHKRSKYECLNCNKTFNSHQALGGHRPCHKKPNVKFGSRYASGENNLEDDDNPPDYTPTRKFESVTNKKQYSSNAAKKIRTKKSKGHECPICFRMFKSGQALGGHKRSHFINGAEDFSNHTPVFKQDVAEIHDMIDLNLPAPEEDEAEENEQFIY